MATELERRAVALALKKMFKENHFSICTVDQCLATLGLQRTSDYKALSQMHCINWADMGEATRIEVMNAVLRMLGQHDPGEAVDRALGVMADTGHQLVEAIERIQDEEELARRRAAPEYKPTRLARWLGLAEEQK